MGPCGYLALMQVIISGEMWGAAIQSQVFKSLTPTWCINSSEWEGVGNRFIRNLFYSDEKNIDLYIDLQSLNQNWRTKMIRA